MLLKIVFVSLVLGIAFSNGAPQIDFLAGTSSCCIKLRVTDPWTGNTASGVYYANPIGTVNGRTRYTSEDEETAIWYDGRNWAIGLDTVQTFKDVEENWNGVFHFATSTEKCPNNLDLLSWKYRDGYVWENPKLGVGISCVN